MVSTSDSPMYTIVGMISLVQYTTSVICAIHTLFAISPFVACIAYVTFGAHRFADEFHEKYGRQTRSPEHSMSKEHFSFTLIPPHLYP